MLLATVSLLAGVTSIEATAAEADGSSDVQLDKPHRKLGLVPGLDLSPFLGPQGLPFAGSVEGLEGADIVAAAATVAQIDKQLAKDAEKSWAKADERAGPGNRIKADRYLVGYIITAARPADGVAFYILVNGADANDLVPGFTLDPRNGASLAILTGVFSGALAVGDTLVAGQAFTDPLESYNTENKTIVWRNGRVIHFMRRIDAQASVAQIHSVASQGSTQVYDRADPGPLLLKSDPIDGLGRVCASVFPSFSPDGGPALFNTVQIGFELDPSKAAAFDPSGLQLVDLDDGAAPIDGSVLVVPDLGWVTVSFGSVPNARLELVGQTPGAEAIAQLMPSVIHANGQALGPTLADGSCASLVEPDLQSGIDACSHWDPAAIGGFVGVDDPSLIVGNSFQNPDGGTGCAWSVEGDPGPFMATILGARLENGLGPVEESLVGCQIVDVSNPIVGLWATCPGLDELVVLNEFDGLGLDDGIGVPAVMVFLRGTREELDELFEDLDVALAAGNDADVPVILGSLEFLTPDEFGLGAATEHQSELLRLSVEAAARAEKARYEWRLQNDPEFRNRVDGE
jgi:hypothetical protein